eukprot:5279845-Lingulodinium_polyedra.AAC.1
MDSPWAAMVCPRAVHGLSMDSPWPVREFSMDRSSMASFRFSMDSPWFVHGQSMDWPWTRPNMHK